MTHRSEIRQALTIRLTEQRLLELFSEGKLFGTVHTSIGQEFVGVAVAGHLREQDYVFSNHRCHGHFLARYDNVEGLVAEIMGKATGVCAGLGGSQHLHQDRFFSNGIQGGIVPVAAGLAYAQKLGSSDGITVAFIGDGTLGEGILYETANLASKWELPLLIVLENNLYAQSTHQSQTLAGDIEQRFQAFAIETSRSDTWNWEKLLEEIGKSADEVRTTGKPKFHRVDTYRLMAHSKGDDDRATEELESYRDRDPLHRILSEHAEEPWLKEILDEVRQRLQIAVEAAEAAPFLDLTSTSRGPDTCAWQTRRFEKQRVVASVREALRDALDGNDKVVLIGEDIESPYGGAFKTTAGLSESHPGRVRNTPISEAAILGVGNGLALAGYRPVVEIMFGDFLTLATDQWVNHAAKFSGMYNDKARVPVIVRTPMGGRRGYGPTHSQSLEKLLLGVPNTQVLCLHHRYSALSLYRDLFASIDRPTLVIENKVLYGQYADPEPPAGYELLFNDATFPVARLKPCGPADLTMVGVGGASLEVEQAMLTLFEEEEILTELFLPTQLYPLDVSFLLESVSATGRLLVVEEGQGFASIGSEILAQVAEHPSRGKAACARVSADPRPIPSARPLEQKCLPSSDAIVEKVLELMDV
jgi:2-oxoisovalerate dehydrogenase E1 component